MDPKVSVLHNSAYITPPQLARRIRKMRVLCRTQSFLDCCVEYNDIQKACKNFSELYRDQELVDPYVFEERVRHLDSLREESGSD